MKKLIKQIGCIAGTAILMICMCFSFVGCDDKEKKYDVSIKIANNYGSTWILHPISMCLGMSSNTRGKKCGFGWILIIFRNTPVGVKNGLLRRSLVVMAFIKVHCIARRVGKMKYLEVR